MRQRLLALIVAAAWPVAGWLGSEGAACALHAVESPEMQEAFATTVTIAGVAVIGAALAVMFRPWLRELAMVGRLVRGDALPPASSGPAPGAVRRQPAVRPWVWRGDDFPGWGSPMLVRELRRGVQSGVFAWMFIGIQGAMFAMMAWAMSLVHGDKEAHSGELAVAFWGAIAVAVAVVVPLRGLTAVSGERLSGNLDLVWLTRLSATKIVVGTWLALMGQVLLCYEIGALLGRPTPLAAIYRPFGRWGLAGRPPRSP